MSTQVYIALTVYDYDSDRRYRCLKHVCRDLKQAQHLKDRLESLNRVEGLRVYGCYGHTGAWLERNHHINGFIDSIEGIFEETTRKVG